MHHAMSPTGVFVLLLLAFVVDYLSVGPDSIRDRLAFLMALPAIREGFNGSPLDQWTVGALSQVIDAAKNAAHGSYLAGAVTPAVLGAGIGLLAIYTIGALLPDKFAGKLGRFASMKFPTSAIHRINYKLWICAALLGLMADLPRGAAGAWLTTAIDALAYPAAGLVNFLFGVS